MRFADVRGALCSSSRYYKIRINTYISKVHDSGFHARGIFMCEVTGRVKTLQRESHSN